MNVLQRRRSSFFHFCVRHDSVDLACFQHECLRDRDDMMSSCCVCMSGTCGVVMTFVFCGHWLHCVFLFTCTGLCSALTLPPPPPPPPAIRAHRGGADGSSAPQPLQRAVGEGAGGLPQERGAKDAGPPRYDTHTQRHTHRQAVSRKSRHSSHSKVLSGCRHVIRVKNTLACLGHGEFG